MKIFLTGGSGFVGGAVIRALAPAHEIVALSRSSASDKAIEAVGGVARRGDLADLPAGALEGADAVIHCAAYVEEWGPLKLYEKINVEGTKHLLKAAREAGVKRFIHIGTEAALFHGQHMRDIDETYPLALNSPFPYSRSKARAERAVREANDPAAGFETFVIRPRLVWGPGDKTVLPVVAAMAAAGKFAWIDGGALMTSTTHIDNLTHAIGLALTSGKSGEAYFVVDGPPVEFRRFLAPYLETAGVALGGRSVPGWLVRGLSNVLEPLWRLVGAKSPPPMTRFTAHIMSRDCTIRDDKAQGELGYRPVVSMEEGLKHLAA